jgi:hypothetical protein
MSKESSKTENPDQSKDNSPISEFKHCFIITPIGEPNSEINLKAFGLINAVMRPVLKDHGYEPLSASDISNAGSINKQILKHIYEDELVICNLTGLNPNVMYELAVRHAVRKPLIIMAEKGTKLPFDVVDQRCVFYDDTLSGVEGAKKSLNDFVSSAIGSDDTISNPIYDSINEASILKQAVENQSPDVYIIKRIDKLESTISTLLKLTSGQISNNYSSSHSFSKANRRNFSQYIYRISTTSTEALKQILEQFIIDIRDTYDITYSVTLLAKKGIFEVYSNGDVGEILLKMIRAKIIDVEFEQFTTS